MKVLVTGGAGVVGSYVVRELVESGEKPVVMDAAPLPPHLAAEFGDRIEFHQFDIGELSPLLHLLLKHKIEAVIHLAALTGTAPDDYPLLKFRVNAAGTMNVLEAARLTGVRRVLFASTRTVYPDFRGTRHGPPDYEPVPEEHWTDVVRPYEVWKLAGERMGEFYQRQFGLDWVAFRFAVYYAAERVIRHGQEHAMGRLHTLMARAIQGVALSQPSGADHPMDIVYVKDLAGIMALALRAKTLPHTVYNAGSGTTVQVRQIVQAIKSVLPGAKLDIGSGADFAPGGWRSCLIDISRAKADLGFSPAWPVEKGIEDCIRRTQDLVNAGFRIP
ncbi:MAG: NAD-dependent epimerase/dehydratase family protein [Bacillota bacterium]|nr:MAG: NAD-dependent epimerase/dehydratase family protein [Bacillota bacterium]